MDKICNYSDLMHWKNKSNFQKMLFSYENNILFSNIFFHNKNLSISYILSWKDFLFTQIYLQTHISFIFNKSLYVKFFQYF